MRSGRFVLLCCVYEAGMSEPEWGYVTSWDTWEQAEAAFPIAAGFKLVDDETGHEWMAHSPYTWEAGRSVTDDDGGEDIYVHGSVA